MKVRMVEAVKIKAVVILSILVIAIGIPAIYYASTERQPTNNPPVAIITAPSSGYTDTPIEFSAANSIDDGFILTYIWDFGDGTKSAGKIVYHTYREEGNYTVTLVVYDNEGAYSYAKKMITIEKKQVKEVKVSVNELLKNVSAYIGKEVVVDGIFGYGRNYSFFLVNNSGYRGIRVYVEPGAQRPETMHYGDLLEIRARFTVYRNEFELKVENNSKDYVKIIGSGGKNTYANITLQNWQEYNNSFIHLTGKVTKVYASYRYSIGPLTVYISFNANRTGSPAVGDVFEVQGFLTYYRSYKYNVSYMEIYVRNSTADFSKYVKSTYQNVSMNSLLEEPDTYNNSAVHIPSAFVISSYASWNFEVSDNISNNASMHVYVERGGIVKGMIFNGAKVELWGNLVLYRGQWEIKIRNATTDKVLVLSKPEYKNISVDKLLGNPQVYNGSNVHSWGIISWLYQNESSHFTLFGLFWNGSEVKVVGFNGSNIGSIQEGYYADVYGEFTSYRGEWEIKIRPKSYDYVVAHPQGYRTTNITSILEAPEDYNNTLVYVPYAKVKNVFANWLFWVSNNVSNPNDLSVYVERGGIVNGTPYFNATVEIWGMVTQYNGSWELKIRNNTDDKVVVVSNATYKEVSITTLLNSPFKYNNTLVYVPEATVVSVYNASWLFWISNSTNSTEDVSVYVEKGAHIDAQVYVGAKVEVWGMVTQFNGKWEIKIRANSGDNVKLITPISNYTVVNITELLENTSNYNGTLVEIPNATVVNVYASWLFWVSNSTADIKDIAVYAEKGVKVPTLGKGDTVKIYGNVTYHNGSYEILLRAGTQDKVVVLHSSAKYVNLSYLHEVDSNGTLVHLGEQVIVNATVISSPEVFSFTSSSGKPILKMYVEDSTGGVLVFGYDMDYTKLNLTEGDMVQIRGTIAQYNGEAELKISSLNYITYLGKGTVPSPLVIPTGYFSNWSAAEKVEGMLVKVHGTVTSVNDNYGYFYLDDGSGAVEIYAKAAGIDISNISQGENLTVIGVVSQYDKTSPYTSYYEILPRYTSDIMQNNTSSKVNDTNFVGNWKDSEYDIYLEEVCVWRIDTVLIAADMWAH